MQKNEIRRFRRIVWSYYRAHGRDLPWRRTLNSYRIMVSEVMLQQTQVDRVQGKYKEFLKAFPNFRALAAVSSAEVLRAWQGLGYNRRALALHRLSKIIVDEYRGKLPRTPEALETLPGVGSATAGSIAAFAFNVPTVFIETNIRRAIIHHFFPRRRKVGEEEIAAIAAAAIDRKNSRAWYWAFMDYGAVLGKLIPNPNRKSARYRRQPTFAGSDRELRGKIVRGLLQQGRSSLTHIASDTGETLVRVRQMIAALAREGFLKQRAGLVMMVEE